MMKWAAFFSALLALLAACAPSSQEFSPGEYLDANGGVTNFNADGTYTVSDSDGKEPVIFGEYNIEGNVITMADNLFYCPDSLGEYHWRIRSDRSLDLEVISEECAGRGRLLALGLEFLRE